MIEKVQTGLIWGFLILFLYFIISSIWQIKTTNESIKTTKYDVEMKDSTLRSVKEWVNQNKKDKEDYQTQITTLQESLKKKSQVKPIKSENIKSSQVERYEVANAVVRQSVVVKDTFIYNIIYKDTLVWLVDTAKFVDVEIAKPVKLKKKRKKDSEK